MSKYLIKIEDKFYGNEKKNRIELFKKLGWDVTEDSSSYKKDTLTYVGNDKFEFGHEYSYTNYIIATKTMDINEHINDCEYINSSYIMKEEIYELEDKKISSIKGFIVLLILLIGLISIWIFMAKSDGTAIMLIIIIPIILSILALIISFVKKTQKIKDKKKQYKQYIQSDYFLQILRRVNYNINMYYHRAKEKLDSYLELLKIIKSYEESNKENNQIGIYLNNTHYDGEKCIELTVYTTAELGINIKDYF